MTFLVDTHYARYLPDCPTLESEIRSRYGRTLHALARRSALVRGVLAWWIGRHFDFVVTINHHPGSFWLILLTGLTGTRKLILLEFMIYADRKDRLLKRLALPVLIPLLLGPALRRSMMAAQVMLLEEPAHYAQLLGIPECRFTPILLALRGDEKAEPAETPREHLVFSSGRAACDWPLLFRAAQGASWKLVIACPRRELQTLSNLDRTGAVTVLADISPDEHAEWLRRAAVYVLPLYDRPISSGQLRVRNAIAAGTPTVATRVRGLQGYAVDGQSALLVEPGDAAGLRVYIDQLIANRDRAIALANRARQFAASRTESGFARSIHDFVFQSAADSRIVPLHEGTIQGSEGI